MKTLDSAKTKKLIDTIVALKNQSEARMFLRDLLTEQELSEFGSRWKAAQMLNDKVPYSKIEKKTGLSSTTIARISKWLNKGMGGYKLMLKKTNHRKHSSFERELR